MIPADFAATIQANMAVPNDARPRGTKDEWGWPRAPLVQTGNAMPKGKSYGKLLPWFVVNEADGGSGATNVRVEVRRLYGRGFYRRQGSTFGMPATMKPTKGAMFPEDFAPTVPSTPASYRDEPSGGVSVLIPAGGGRCWHSWTDDAITIAVPGDEYETLSTIEARLILDDPNGRDDRHLARYVLGLGWDWYNPDWTYGEGKVDGPYRWVTPDWRVFSVSTLSPATIATRRPAY